MIVISEWMDEASLELLQQIPRESIYQPDLWANQLLATDLLRAADALVIRNNTQITESLLQGAPCLKVIGRLGVGLDNIDLDACQTHRITVVYARGANAIPVVEYVLQALLYGMRPWIDWSNPTKQGLWQRQL